MISANSRITEQKEEMLKKFDFAILATKYPGSNGRYDRNGRM
jgi:hypothetical protein